TAYAGKVHFTSSDPNAVLPADYAFTNGDAGVHTFSVTLKTAGAQSITASDTITSSLIGTEAGITVNPAAASTMIVAGFPSSTTAGSSWWFTVTLNDAFGNIASGYQGTVHLSSSDARRGLPVDYPFTANDAGVHTLSATLTTAGMQSITVKDIANPSLASTESGITVVAAAAAKFIFNAPSTIMSGVPFSLTITVVDAYGNNATNYTGTIHFSSTDKRATLPSDYKFTTADQGKHTFSGVILRSTGFKTITVKDISNLLVINSIIIDVLSTKKH